MINDEKPVKLEPVPDLPRGLDDIRKDYVMICSEAGDLQFTIQEVQDKLNHTNSKIRKLKEEFQKLEQQAKP